jgi:hypothetical protein
MADLIREHPITQEVTVHRETVTFIDGTEKTFTYHEKEEKGNTVVLYEYDLENPNTGRTDFGTNRIEDEDGNIYREKIPYPPKLNFGLEEKQVLSLGTWKYSTIEPNETVEVVYEDHHWSAVTEMPEEAALAYQRHFGSDKFEVRV